MGAKVSIKKPPPVNKYVIFFFACLLIIPLITRNTVILNILIYTYLYAFFTYCWSILGQFVGQHSLGHAVYFGLGAYISTLLFVYYDITPWIGMLFGGLCVMVIAILLGFPSFKARGLYYILMTFAFAEVVRILFVFPFRSFSGGAEGIPISFKSESPAYYFQFVSKIPYYYLILLLLLAIMYLTFRIDKSRFGYFLKTISEDEAAAASIGVNVLKYKLIAAGISGFLSGIAGTFYVQFLHYIGPNDVFSLATSFRPLVLSWFGGSGLFGPLLGAFILTPTGEILNILFGGVISGLQLIIYALSLILVITFLPYGVLEPLTKHVFRPMSQFLTTLTKKDLKNKE